MGIVESQNLKKELDNTKQETTKMKQSRKNTKGRIFKLGRGKQDESSLCRCSSPWFSLVGDLLKQILKGLFIPMDLKGAHAYYNL